MRSKRKWRNLLLDPNYQLLFTAVLVVSCGLFMAGLGWIVLKEADTATTTAIQNVQGNAGLDGAIAASTIAHLEGRRELLGWILGGLGLGISAGLFAYGLKMTHHVAGPMFKIAAYCDHISEGHFEELTGLRRHDQLVDLYGHFKQAYEVIRARQIDDANVLAEVIVAADQADLASRSPELAACLENLRARRRAKEVTLG